MRGWTGDLQPDIGSDDMNRSGLGRQEKAKRHGSRSGAPASHGHAGVVLRSPIFATGARRQQETGRESGHASEDRNFVGSISECDDR